MVQSFGKKNDAKNARVLKREGASYFRFARFIYVPTILSGSLAQAVRKLSVLQNKKWKKKKKTLKRSVPRSSSSSTTRSLICVGLTTKKRIE